MADSHIPAKWQLPFFTIWGGQAISLLGSQLVQFALIWYLTELTGSATTLATAALAGLIPQVLLSPLIGTLVDRWPRRWVMVVADTMVVLATVALAALFWLELVEIWHIYVLLFVRAVGGGFHQSAMGASIVLMVPKKHLSRIQGLNHTLNGGLNLVAAPLGAFLLAFLSMQAILAIDVVTAFLAIVPLLFIAVPQPPRDPAVVVKQSVWQEMRAGFTYIWGWPALVIILVMVMFINFLLTPVHALLPLLVADHFGGGAVQFGWLEAISAAGVVLGGLLLGIWGGFQRRIITAQLGLIGLGSGVLLMGIAPSSAFWLAMVAAALTGLMTPITNGSFGAVLQASIAPDMQGRVFAVILSAATAMAPIGLVIAGPISDVVGIQTWFVAGGLVCAGMGILGFFIPAVMGFETRDGGESVDHLPADQSAG